MNFYKEIPTPRNLREFYYNYQLPLARAFFQIERRGVQCDESKLGELRDFLLQSLEELADAMETITSRRIAYSKAHAERMGWERKDYINLSSPKDVGSLLKSRGLILPKNRMTHHETVDEEALNQLYAETGDQILMEILRGREYTKILGTYVNAKLHQGVLYSTYRVTGTVTGRRSASKNIFGFGTNHQNLPKHSELGHRFRRCIGARDGKILISCDQSQAEDWIVSAIIADVGNDYTGLNELREGIDRHRKLGAKLFHKPESECGKDTPERFFGKKTRHAGHYDVGPDEFAYQLVKEGHTGFTPALCAELLDGFHRDQPGIRQIFHKYIQNQIESSRMLRTPLGRERIFFGARPFANNNRVFKEGYAQIPQSTVGDNTGLAILYCELNDPGLVIMDSHDAIALEVADEPRSVERGIELLTGAFSRTLAMPNGLEIQIPIEYEVGYNLAETVGFKNPSDASSAYRRCQENASATVSAGLD